MYSVVYREKSANGSFQKTVFKSAVLEECYALIENHQNSCIPYIRKMAEEYEVITAQGKLVKEAA